MCDPGHIGRIAAEKLLHRLGLAGFKIVVAAHDVQADENHTLMHPHGVFHIRRMLGVNAGLAHQSQWLLPQRLPALKKHLPQLAQTLQGVMGAIVGPVAVGPLVVPRGVHQRFFKHGEMPQLGLKLFVGTRGRAGFEVAHMDGKGGSFAVDLCNQSAIWGIGHRRGAIRQITQGHKLKALRRQSLKPHECAHPKPHTQHRLEPSKAGMKRKTLAGADQTVQKTHGDVLGEIRGDQDMINCPSGLKNG